MLCADMKMAGAGQVALCALLKVKGAVISMVCANVGTACASLKAKCAAYRMFCADFGAACALLLANAPREKKTTPCLKRMI